MRFGGNRVLRALIIGSGVLLGMQAGGPVARAQDETPAVDLQRENDQLRQRIARLEAQLREANRRIKALEAQLADQSGGGGSAGGGGSEPEDEGGFADLPGDPLACPTGIREALIESYNEQAFAGESFDTRATKARYVRAVQNWARRVERQIGGDIEWLIRLDAVQEENSRSIRLRFEVLDPVSRKPYGPATEAVVARRTALDMLDAPSGTVWRITGSVSAKPQVNPDRESSQPDEMPALIGPFAEDGYELFIKEASEQPAP